MECPGCKANVGPAMMKMEVSAEEAGIEVNYTCRRCRTDFFAVLGPSDFMTVD